MNEQKFTIGTEVFFSNIAFGFAAGVIYSAKIENGKWIYDIRVGEYICTNILESDISLRTEFPEIKYKLWDIVKLKNLRNKDSDKTVEGKIFNIDQWGTFEQNEEPSYDICVVEADGTECIWKHIRQSYIIELVKAYKEE